MPVTTTTDLPDTQDLTLDASVEDQFTASWTDVTNYGNYDLEYREAGEGASYQLWSTLDESTASDVITGLEDGEQYDVRVRSRTEHVTGDWFVATAVTLFPAPDGLVLNVTGTSSIDATWNDPIDNEDGFRVYLAEEVNNDPQDDQGFTAFSVDQTVGPNVTSASITGLDDNTEYRVYIEAFTEHVVATTSTQQALTDLFIEGQGWNTVLTDGDGDQKAIRSDDIIDVDWKREHSALTDFAQTIPYSHERLEYWLDGSTEAAIYYAGTQLFDGYLERASSDEQQNTTKLEGRGVGRDLKDVEVSQQFTATATHDAIDTIWGLTGFSATVQPPNPTEVISDQSVLTADSDGDFQGVTSIADDVPLRINGGGVELLKTCFTVEAENYDSQSGDGLQATDDPSYSGREAIGFRGQASTRTYTFTPQYDIPEGDFEIQYRNDATSGPPNIDWTLSGADISTTTATTNTLLSMTWNNVFQQDGVTTPALTAGTTYTIDIQDGGNDSGGARFIDVVAPYDSRYPPTFDNTLDGNDALDGPERYPLSGVPVTFDTVDVTYNVTDIIVDTTWDDVSNGQAIEASNDAGNTFTTANNTADATLTPSTVGTQIVFRAQLSGYGSQTSTPTQGISGQSLDFVDVAYNGNDLSVIDDQRLTGSILDVQQKLHRRAGYHFSIDQVAYSVESYPAGSITKAKNWTVKNRKPTHDLYDYQNRVVVYGAKQGDGTRPKAVAEDAGDISARGGDPNGSGGDRKGVTSVTLIRPDLETLADVKSLARSEVSSRVDQKSITGSVDVWPTDVQPGYDYPVDWYGDGATVDATLNRVSVQEGYANNTATLKFERDRGNDPQITQAKFVSATLTETV